MKEFEQWQRVWVYPDVERRKAVFCEEMHFLGYNKTKGTCILRSGAGNLTNLSIEKVFATKEECLEYITKSIRILELQE